MSEFAPELAAPRLVLAVGASEAPVPPLATARSVPLQSALLMANVPPKAIAPVPVIVVGVAVIVNPFGLPDVVMLTEPPPPPDVSITAAPLDAETKSPPETVILLIPNPVVVPSVMVRFALPASVPEN